MSWRESMRPAKFRGVPFYVEGADYKGGRRGPVHEFPQTDTPWREDMGRKARGFSLEGYVLGDEYLTLKNELITALEEEGPAELIHPYYGTLRVAVGDFTVRETRSDGGIARFSIEFFETGSSAPQPATVVNAVSKVASSAAVATDAVGADFLAHYNPGTLLDSISGALESATQEISGFLPGLPLDVHAIANLRVRISDFAASLPTLVLSGSALLGGLVSFFRGLSDAVNAAGAVVPTGALLKVYDFNPGNRPPATTVNREQERANFDATYRLVQRLALIQAATLAPLQNFVSYEDAVAIRQTIVDLIDEQADVVSDDTFPSMLQLRADLVTAVPGEDGDLPRLIAYTPATDVPSLVLAHRLYGNLDLEADLVARNHVQNPAFIFGGITLEVLSRG